MPGPMARIVPTGSSQASQRPIAVVVGSFASPEARLKETLVFAAVLTALCIGLFKYVLRLPIPVIAFT